MPLLDDFLAAFRMLALNPNNSQARDTKTSEIAGRSLRMLVQTLSTLPHVKFKYAFSAYKPALSFVECRFCFKHRRYDNARELSNDA